MMKVPKGVAKSIAFSQNSVPLEAWVVGLSVEEVTVIDSVKNQNKSNSFLKSYIFEFLSPKGRILGLES